MVSGEVVAMGGLTGIQPITDEEPFQRAIRQTRGSAPPGVSPSRVFALQIARAAFSRLAISACFRYGDTTSARGRSIARGSSWRPISRDLLRAYSEAAQP